ncbi:DUF58 domain-containing protein [Aliikangiella sp. IMCC44632]
MPKGRTIRLSQHSTYIWPTRTGYFLLGMVILMLIGATNYQNNLAFLVTFLLVGVGLVCIIVTFKNMQGIEFKIKTSDEVFAGDAVPVIVFTQSFDNIEHYVIGIGESLERSQWINLLPNEKQQIGLKVGQAQRGYYQLPRLMVTSCYPFGWFRTWAYFSLSSPVLVFPKPVQPKHSRSNYAGQDSDEGKKLAGSTELYGLKPYQVGEPLSRIDWKSYARERGMYMREFADYQAQDLYFSWEDFPQVEKELRLSYLSFLVINASAQGLRFGLSLPQLKIPYGEGAGHRLQCLKALALFQKDSNASTPREVANE